MNVLSLDADKGWKAHFWYKNCKNAGSNQNGILRLLDLVFEKALDVTFKHIEIVSFSCQLSKQLIQLEYFCYFQVLFIAKAIIYFHQEYYYKYPTP